MSQLKVYVLFPLLVLGLLYAGVKFYIHYRVTEQADRVVAMARTFADVSFQGVASDLRGSLSVEGIEVRTPGQTLPARIAELRLEGPNTGFLFDLAGGFGHGRPPQSMRIVLERVELPDLAEWLPADLTLNDGGDLPALRRHEECSLGWLVQNVGMLRGDVYPLYLDMSAGYRIDIEAGVAELDYSYQVLSRERVEMRARLSGVSRPGAVMLGAVPSVDRLTLTYSPNPEQISGLVGRCAEARGLTPEGYLADLLAAPDLALERALGFVPGPGLREAIRVFFSTPGEVRLEMGPIENPMSLAATPETPQQMLASLAPSLSVSGQVVTDLSFRENAAAPSRRAGAGAGEDAASDQPRVRARMLPAEPEELVQYLGRDVHIYTETHQKPLVGILKSVAEGQVNVEKRAHGGTMVMHVPLDEITRAAVYRYPKEGE